MKTECYFSVDIEASGPVPGIYSLLSVGACVVGDYDQTFYAELKPLNKNYVSAALSVSGFTLEKLEETGKEPETVMSSFRNWVLATAGERKPVFVGFNASFDWQFINWYFEKFQASNPFGFGAVDIKSYYMGLSGVTWAATSSSQLPKIFQPDFTQTHNALDDAKAQASMFDKMLRHKRAE